MDSTKKNCTPLLLYLEFCNDEIYENWFSLYYSFLFFCISDVLTSWGLADPRETAHPIANQFLGIVKDSTC